MIIRSSLHGVANRVPIGGDRRPDGSLDAGADTVSLSSLRPGAGLAGRPVALRGVRLAPEGRTERPPVQFGSDHYWTTGTGPGSRHYRDTGTGPGSQHYWNTGSGPGSEHYWRTGSGPGSQHYWNTGSGPGSEHYWSTGSGPGSEHYWSTGTGPGSEHYRDTGTGPGEPPGDLPWGPFHGTLPFPIR